MSQPSNPQPIIETAAADGKLGRLSGLMRIFSSTIALLAITGCALIAAVVVAGIGGAIAGQNELNARATQTVTADISVQFSQAMADLEMGNYSLAASRFRWVLDVAPDYPGAKEGLAQAESMINQTLTPIATLPLSGSQDPAELFAEAEGYYKAAEWANAITRFQELQAISPTHREAEVKEMLYRALVTLGLQYVRGDRLQEGLTLLDQARVIRPLDDQAEGERHLATMYVTARTYFGLNWPITIDNLETIYAVAPDYRDVEDRLWQAYVAFGDQLVALGGHCDAAMQYDEALKMRRKDELQAKLDAATEACANPTPTPTGDLTTTPEGTFDPFPIWTATPSP
jgi:tetratricopeptide (TPR) repeat protein